MPCKVMVISMNKLKRALSALCVASLLLIPALSFTGCNESTPKPKVHLTYETGRLVNAEEDLSYKFASVSWEPVAVGDVYADWDEKLLYEVAGVDPETILTEEFAGVGGLLYAEDKPLPEIGQMKADEILVCTTGSKTVGIMSIVDRAVVEKAASLLSEGETVDPPEPTNSYSFKFMSPDYEGLYYNVIYIEVGTGKDLTCYLYDRGTKRCVEMPYDLFYGHMYSDEESVLPEGGMDIGDLEEGDEAIVTFAP